MFRPHGKNRTLLHNIQLAALLSFVAGLVNVTGLFALKVLTTNVTGHFAYFSEEVFRKDWLGAWNYLLYTIAFLAGSFFSNLIVEFFARRDAKLANVLPVLVEILLLVITAIQTHGQPIGNPALVACSLLFAMGLQNALVTAISHAAVRTTHLTGLFTDLGIELSQLIFFRKPEQVKRLRGSIKLRAVIVTAFFTGCVFGGVLYSYLDTLTLLIASACLVGGLIYSSVRVRLARLGRLLTASE